MNAPKTAMTGYPLGRPFFYPFVVHNYNFASKKLHNIPEKLYYVRTKLTINQNTKIMLYTIDFQNYLTDVRGFSALTAKTYCQCLTKFTFWLSKQNCRNERHVTELEAARFFAFCRSEQGLAAKTINLHRSALISYYSYCIKFHGYVTNPFRETDALKVEKTLPHWITEDTINRVVERLPRDTYEGLRDRLAILLMAHCGLRCSEICGLRMSDITPTEVIVHGKGNKWRVVPISRAVFAAWQDYMLKRSMFVSDWLLLKCDGSQITRAALFSLVRRAFAMDCPSEDCHPHALRHSFATICMLHGVPLSSIAHWMGHVSESTTLKYMALVNSKTNPFDTF